jgi:hypothetical protein
MVGTAVPRAGLLIAFSALGGGLLGGMAGTFSWFIVSFDRCFTF